MAVTKSRVILCPRPFSKKLEIKVSRNYYVMRFLGTKSREKTKRERKNLASKSEKKTEDTERKREREKKDSNQTGQKRFITHKITGGCSYFRVTKTKLFSRKSVQPSHRPTLFHLLIHHAVFTSHLSLIFRLQLTTEKHLYSQGNF